MKRRTLSLACAVVGLLAGCEEPEETHVYVVSRIDFSAPTADGLVAGFDLDDAVSDGTGETCGEMASDFVSPITGADGVDNQFGRNAALLSTEGDAFRDAVASGTFLLVMAVTSNGLTNDPSARVHLYLADGTGPPCDGTTTSACPAGSTCPAGATEAMPRSCGPSTGADEVILPGQELAVRREIATVDATITEGRLFFEVDELTLSLLSDREAGDLGLLGALVGGDIAESTITNGEIGGAVTLQSIVDYPSMGFPISEEALRAIFHPDLMPSADGTTCSAASIGLSFEAVGAVIRPTE